MKKLKWILKKVYLKDRSIRERKNNWTGNQEEYAVLFVTLDDPFNGHTLTPGRKKVEKQLTFMCFLSEIYNRLVIGDKFSFSGFASFKPGNTFFVVERVKDSLGFDVVDEESHYNRIPESSEEE